MIRCCVHTKELQGEQTSTDCWLDRQTAREREDGGASQAFLQREEGGFQFHDKSPVVAKLRVRIKTNLTGDKIIKGKRNTNLYFCYTKLWKSGGIWIFSPL